MRRERALWPAVIAAAGIAIFLLSFVPAWLVHERILSGEGYRTNTIQISAWAPASLPVVAAAAVVGLLAAAVAAARVLRPERVPGWLLFAAPALAFALLLACAVPVGQAGHASRVNLTPGWALIVAIFLGALMLGAALAMVRPGRRILVASAALAVLVLVAGSVGRVVALNLKEGDGRHWEPGSYSRPATADEPAETLVLTETTFEIGGRWAGALEWSGWTIVFDEDPACPGSRGSYHAHAAGDGGLRFVAIIDTCLGDERSRDLQTGIWARDP